MYLWIPLTNFSQFGPALLPAIENIYIYKERALLFHSPINATLSSAKVLQITAECTKSLVEGNINYLMSSLMSANIFFKPLNLQAEKV